MARWGARVFSLDCVVFVVFVVFTVSAVFRCLRGCRCLRGFRRFVVGVGWRGFRR